MDILFIIYKGIKLGLLYNTDTLLLERVSVSGVDITVLLSEHLQEFQEILNGMVQRF